MIDICIPRHKQEWTHAHHRMAVLISSILFLKPSHCPSYPSLMAHNHFKEMSKLHMWHSSSLWWGPCLGLSSPSFFLLCSHPSIFSSPNPTPHHVFVHVLLSPSSLLVCLENYFLLTFRLKLTITCYPQSSTDPSSEQSQWHLYSYALNLKLRVPGPLLLPLPLAQSFWQKPGSVLRMRLSLKIHQVKAVHSPIH